MPPGVRFITASTTLYWKTGLRRPCFAPALTAAGQSIKKLRSLKDGDVVERIRFSMFEQEILYCSTGICGIIPGTFGNQPLKSLHKSMAFGNLA